MIPISQPVIDERTEGLVLDVLRSGNLAAGRVVAELERHFSEVAGTKHAIAMSSGTAALETVMELTLRPGQAIVTTPFTFAASVSSALRAGLEVRLVDIDDNFNLDASHLEEAIDPRTAAILPVHMFGRPCDMATIGRIATDRQLILIEDAAQAIGSSHGGRPVGSWGVGCFSLYATKNVTSAEGGVVTTDDDFLADGLRTLVNQGSPTRYQYSMIGTNRRMTDIHAAIAIPQLESLDELTKKRRDNAHVLSEGLSGLPGLITPGDTPGHVYHQYTVRVTPAAPIERSALQALLTRQGIGSETYYPRLIHDYPTYSSNSNLVARDTPRARRLVSEVLSLPVHPGLNESDLARIIESVRQGFGY